MAVRESEPVDKVRFCDEYFLYGCCSRLISARSLRQEGYGYVSSGPAQGVCAGAVPTGARLSSLLSWRSFSRLRAVHGFHAPLSLADRDDRRREQRGSCGVFAPIGFGPRRPAVVVLHILGSDFPLSRYMAARLADRGVAALFVKLPYYGERRPPDRKGQSTKRFLSGDIERSMLAMRQGVCDVRRAVSWLNSRPDVDGTRLAVAGISLGGIVASVSAAVDPAIQHGAFLLAGGDLSVILWGMPEGAPFRKLWLDSGRTQARSQGVDRPVRPIDLCQTVSRQAHAHDRGQGRRGRSSRCRPWPSGKRRAGPPFTGTTAAITRRSVFCCRAFAGPSISWRRLNNSARLTRPKLPKRVVERNSFRFSVPFRSRERYDRQRRNGMNSVLRAGFDCQKWG